MKIEIPVITYEEALKTYNTYANALGIEPKKNGDIITVNELRDIINELMRKSGFTFDLFDTSFDDLYGYGPIILKES